MRGKLRSASYFDTFPLGVCSHIGHLLCSTARVGGLCLVGSPDLSSVGQEVGSGLEKPVLPLYTWETTYWLLLGSDAVGRIAA